MPHESDGAELEPSAGGAGEGSRSCRCRGSSGGGWLSRNSAWWDGSCCRDPRKGSISAGGKTCRSGGRESTRSRASSRSRWCAMRCVKACAAASRASAAAVAASAARMSAPSNCDDDGRSRGGLDPCGRGEGWPGCPVMAETEVSTLVGMRVSGQVGGRRGFGGRSSLRAL